MSGKLTINEKRNKKKLKKKSSAHKASLAFLVLTIITTMLVWICALGYFTTALIVLPLIVILIFVVLIPSVFTLFLIWMNEDYRNFVQKLSDLIIHVGEKAPEILQTIFPYIAAVAGAFAIIAFVLNLVFYIKKKEIKGLKGKFITSCVFLGLTLIAIILGAVLIFK